MNGFLCFMESHKRLLHIPDRHTSNLGKTWYIMASFNLNIRNIIEQMLYLSTETRCHAGISNVPSHPMWTKRIHPKNDLTLTTFNQFLGHHCKLVQFKRSNCSYRRSLYVLWTESSIISHNIPHCMLGIIMCYHAQHVFGKNG